MKYTDEDMETLLVLPADFPYGELQRIAAILESAEVFVPGYIPPVVGLYHLDGFIHHAWVERSETILLPDRNIASRMAQIARGKPLNGGDSAHRRKVAAMLAFAQCLDIQIEPSIAFHELAPSQGNDAARDELAWLRVADNGNPQEWVAVALGHADRIRTIGLPPTVEALDLAKPLKRWRRNYVATLKIGTLELTPELKAVDRALALFQWMYTDFILAGPAALFACIYFAPHSPPREGLLKSLRSHNRERAIAGAKNAAWDITHLSDFARRINEEPDENPRRFIFATLDEALRAIARLVIGEHPDMAPSDGLALSLRQWWPAMDAQRIAEAWFSYLSQIRDPNWWQQFKNRRDYVGDLIAQGEHDIRAWHPPSKS